MKLTGVQKLARVLRVLVIAVLICNIIALFLVPGAVSLRPYFNVTDMLLDVTVGGDFFFESASPAVFRVLYLWCFLESFGEVWHSAYTAALTVFLWACGLCTAVILWQAKGVLDSILREKAFTLETAAKIGRAAACCFVISGAALGRTVWGLCTYRSAAPLLTYNFLFVPLFLLAGLVCMVMSALFRQAAEMKAENDLTI
jgi:hypothetical protein